MRQIICLCLVAVIAGCAASGHLRPADDLSRWIGEDIGRVIASWGPPSREAYTQEGKRLVYDASRYGRRYYPVNLAPSGPFPGAGPEELECRGVFETDAAGTVLRAAWVGEECY